MSLDYLQLSIEIFWPVLVSSVGVAGVFLATVAVVDSLNRLLARFK